MIDYEDLDQELKDSLTEIACEDGDNLQPSTLYRNIANSSGTDESLAKIFEVPLNVIIEIKKINEKDEVEEYEQ